MLNDNPIALIVSLTPWTLLSRGGFSREPCWKAYVSCYFVLSDVVTWLRILRINVYIVKITYLLP